MFRFYPTILFFSLAIALHGQSPHGDDFKMNCAACHTAESWDIPADFWQFEEFPKTEVSKMTGMEIEINETDFNHFKTDFRLEGSHAEIDCRACHTTLVFSEAQTDCISCHTDMHAQSVGSDCARCHNTETWLVDNIFELHEENSFPLIGAHDNVSCVNCHISETDLRFDPIGNDCISCHLDDFSATQSPDHENLGFSKTCIECHDPLTGNWNTDIVDHDFFPLTGGHDIQDCQQCHLADNYSDISPECISCHQDNFDNTSDPDHGAAQFSTDCTICHTTAPSWQPAEYTAHDGQYFPIYSGSHEGEWNDCIDCHTNPNNFAEFSCTNCHQNPQTDNEHGGVNGYIYQDNACLACHPAGEGDDGFDHNNTAFPLTGEHVGLDCMECHADGFEGTPTDCNACHAMDYSGSINPNHVELNLPTDCASCHTTDADWMPASFAIHDDFYVLNGAHAIIANDCAACHNGDYVNTPNTCVGCHLDDYNNTTDPDHDAAQFPTDCEQCHSEDAWTPSSFDHDSFYPLVGAHANIATNCDACHNGNYVNTPNTCVGCHLDTYNATTDPNHINSNFSTDCESCHTQDSWIPSTFDHDVIYPLVGEHANIANDCNACHNGDYNNTPNTCVGCHLDDYNNTNDPNHSSAQFPTDCEQCHNENGWTPSTFDHDNMYFPIYSGKHDEEWNQCSECHTTAGDYSLFSCIDCHEHDDPTDLADKHDEVSGYVYQSAVCYSCHPDGDD